MQVPSQGGDLLTYDLTEINTAVSRIVEVSAVNDTKAPELLRTFNVAWIQGQDVANALAAMIVEAKREMERVKGIVVLDKMKTVLATKGLATTKNPLGSEDLRAAVLSQDPEYQESLERVAMLEAMRAIVKTKVDGLEMAYNSVKKILGEPGSHQYGGDARTHGGAQVDARARSNGFGTPRY